MKVLQCSLPNATCRLPSRVNVVARRVKCGSATNAPPSSATASSQLQRLQQFSVILSDQVLKTSAHVDKTTPTAVVNFALLNEIVGSSLMTEYLSAVERGVTYAKQTGGDTNAAMDRALVNIGLILKDVVEGRVVVEVDPRLSHDAAAMEARAKSLVAAFEEMGCPRSKLLMQLPATWEGLQAVAALEKGGINCETTRVYSFPQGVQAVKAKASVVMADIRRIDTWYDKHPGVLRDPRAPRQDASEMGKSHVGVRIVTAIFNYAQKAGGHTKVVVAGIREADEAVALSGIDYMVLPDAVQSDLASTGTLQGYNDGLSAAASGEDDGMPSLSAELAAAYEFRPSEVADIDQSTFEQELGMAGRDLLTKSLESAVESTDRVARFVESFAVGRE